MMKTEDRRQMTFEGIQEKITTLQRELDFFRDAVQDYPDTMVALQIPHNVMGDFRKAAFQIIGAYEKVLYTLREKRDKIFETKGGA